MQVQAAREELLKMAKCRGQQRFTPADVQAFLASLSNPAQQETQASPSGGQHPASQPETALNDARPQAEVLWAEKSSKWTHTQVSAMQVSSRTVLYQKASSDHFDQYTLCCADLEQLACTDHAKKWSHDLHSARPLVNAPMRLVHSSVI